MLAGKPEFAPKSSYISIPPVRRLMLIDCTKKIHEGLSIQASLTDFRAVIVKYHLEDLFDVTITPVVGLSDASFVMTALL